MLLKNVYTGRCFSISKEVGDSAISVSIHISDVKGMATELATENKRLSRYINSTRQDMLAVVSAIVLARKVKLLDFKRELGFVGNIEVTDSRFDFNWKIGIESTNFKETFSYTIKSDGRAKLFTKAFVHAFNKIKGRNEK